MSWDWDWYPKPKPRRPANGIRAQSKKFGQTWWASQWLAALERLVDPARLSRGRSYARSGQVLNIDVSPGLVRSRVQGSRPKPYDIEIHIKPISDREWNEVADAMAAQAIFAARLLAGEMPQDIEQAFSQAGTHLFPQSRGDLKTECSCPDYANPCKHIAAVYYLLGEQFDADPFLIFRLRGKDKQTIMSMLRDRRSASVEPDAQARPKARRQPASVRQPQPAPVARLDECLDHFWESGASLDDIHVTIKPPEVEAAPVKRLGEPGFWRNSKKSWLSIMAGAYRFMTEASLQEALGEEQVR